MFPNKPLSLRRIPLALQTVALVLVVGILVWLVLDSIQGQELRETFLAELSNELNERAKEDRRIFDRHIQGIHDAAKLIVEQKQFWDHINSPAWSTIQQTSKVLHHHELPSWLPRASILRSFFHASHAMLLDSKGMAREVYHHIPHPPDESDVSINLLNPTELLQLLSHNQAYMTSLDGQAVVIAIRQAKVAGKLMATLMLISAIDNEFLFEARHQFETDNIMVLLDPMHNEVVASSNQELAPSGTSVDELKQDFLLMGKDQQVMPTGSFFDYGASDLDLRFVSLVPTAKAEQMADVIHHKNSQQRMLLVAVLVAVFSLIIMGMVHRIRALTLDLVNFTKGKLGGAPLELMRGDELTIMEKEFKNLSDEVLQNQARIQAHADEKIELVRQAAEGEQRKRELESLRSVTEALGIGIIFDGKDGPVAFNSLMEEFSLHCGGIEHFLLRANQPLNEMVLQDKDGKQRVFMVDQHASLGDQGALVRDVTVTRQIEHSRKQLLSILDEATDFVSSADLKGNILYINEGGRQLIGISEDEDVSKLHIRDLHSDNIFQLINEKGLTSASKHGAWTGDTALLTRDGREIVTSQVILAHKDNQGQLEYYSTIARDISKQKEMEFELQQANEGLRQEITQRELIEQDLKAAIHAADEANKAKSEFLANMSHEIRTPMQAIIGMADVLSETELTKEQAHLVTTLEHAGNNLLEIVNNILDLSKIEAGKVELSTAQFDISQVINTIMRICSYKARNKGLEISFNVENNIPPILLGDKTYLQQILINLIDNAIKFTEQGSIAVRVTADQANRCHHVADSTHKLHTCCLQFSVTDTGIGIPLEVQQKIFDAFSQADASTTRLYGGTGLGTTISKKIVEKMGGQLWVDSEPGKGSTFFFTAEFIISQDQAMQDDIKTVSETSEENEKPLNILVAEDTEDIRMLILTYLKKHPYTIDMVKNGAEAVEKYQAANYNLILMDMEMPVMDGYTAVKTIRQLEANNPDYKPTPIVALTAHALREHEQKSLDAGCTGHATKPIKKAQLLALIRDFARR